MTAEVAATLSAAHRRSLLDGSGIDERVVEGRGYRTLRDVEFAEMVEQELFYDYLLKADGWMAVPVFRPDGRKHCDIIRLDKTIGSAKYVWPMGLRNALDVHPYGLEHVGDPTVPLIVTEGIKKGDAILSRILAGADSLERACVVSVNGCWGWRSGQNGSSIASPDFHDIALENRRIIVVPDSDYYTNPNVRAGWDELVRYLASKAGKDQAVSVAVPDNQGLEKCGADDYLLAHTLDDLLGRARHPAAIEPTRRLQAIEIVWADRLLEQASVEVPTVVKGLFAERSINVLAGHTQTMKTWLAFHLSLDGALGFNWHGHPELSVPVPFRSLYFNKEMAREAFASRLLNLYLSDRFNGRIGDLAPLVGHVDEARVDFNDPDAVALVTDLIGENAVKVAFLDSFSMLWSGDENSSKDVGVLYQKLREITQLTGVMWVLLHHLVKPSKDRAAISQLFHVRGSGQIIQQADAAVLLNLSRVVDEHTKEIAAYHAKARATGEYPAWLIEFTRDRDTGLTTLQYSGRLSEVKAVAYASSHGDPDVLTDWVNQTLLDQPALQDVGIRRPALIEILKASWPSSVEKRPSDSTLQRAVARLIEEGVLSVKDKNQRLGDLLIFERDDSVDHGEVEVSTLL